MQWWEIFLYVSLISGFVGGFFGYRIGKSDGRLEQIDKNTHRTLDRLLAGQAQNRFEQRVMGREKL